MLKLSILTRCLQLATVAGLLTTLAAPAMAGTLYSWQTEDGVTSFTDDPKRIPARYRGQVTERNAGSLKGYERYTPVSASADAKHGERLAARLSDLRKSALPAVSAPPRGRVVRTVAPGVGVSIDVGDIDINLAGLTSDAPVTVEDVRVRDRNSSATRTVRVVRQNGRVIATVKGSPNESNPSFLPYESDL